MDYPVSTGFKTLSIKTNHQNFRFGYNGGTFLEDEIRDALIKGYPLTMDLAIPGKCLNNCIYCGYYEVNKDIKLTQPEIINLIDQFGELGGKSVKILGEGEPLLRKDIFKILEVISSKNIIPVLFTCGDVIGNDSIARKIHRLSGLEVAKILNELKVTIMLKYEASGLKQDEIVRRKNYHEMRDNALEILLKLRFNRFSPTRLGFGIVLLKENMNEIKEVYRYSIDNNIYPLICPIMPIGKMISCNERAAISPDQVSIKEFHKELCKIRKSMGIIISNISDFPGCLPCDISRTGLYVDDTGNVKVCEADETVGNIKNEVLASTWEKINEFKWTHYKNNRELGLCQPKRKYGIL